MSRTYRDRDRHIRVQAIRKDPVDLRRLSRAVIAFAQAQAEAEAQATETGTTSVNKANETSRNGAIKTPVTVNRKTVADKAKTVNIVANTIPAAADDDTTDDGDAA